MQINLKQLAEHWYEELKKKFNTKHDVHTSSRDLNSWEKEYHIKKVEKK